MIDSFRHSPRGQTGLVFPIRNQKGQFSHVVMPKWLHVALLMTLTPEPLSTMHPEISVPCTSTLMAGFWWSMMVGIAVDSTKFAGIITWGVYNHVSIACRKLGTRLSSLLIVSVIGQSAKTCHIRSASCTTSYVAIVGVFSCRMRSTFASLNFVTQAFVALCISSFPSMRPSWFGCVL